VFHRLRLTKFAYGGSIFKLGPIFVPTPAVTSSQSFKIYLVWKRTQLDPDFQLQAQANCQCFLTLLLGVVTIVHNLAFILSNFKIDCFTICNNVDRNRRVRHLRPTQYYNTCFRSGQKWLEKDHLASLTHFEQKYSFLFLPFDFIINWYFAPIKQKSI
jgi:hypothetical protein